MVVIISDPWDTGGEKPSVHSLVSIGFQDLASDYYQVLRQRKRPLVFKIIWVVVLAILMGFTVYMIYGLLSDYLEYNSFTQIRTEWKNNVTLPAISICSTNNLNYTKWADALYANESTKDVLDKFDEYLDQIDKIGKTSFYDYNEFNDTLDNVFSKLDHLWATLPLTEQFTWLYLSFRNDVSSMPVGAYHYLFGNVGQNIEDFDKVTYATELGYCLELNDDGRLIQSLNGVQGGFTIDVDAKLNDYFPHTKSEGFVVFIRDQDETIMLNRGGYVISPGTETFMSLTKKSVSRMGEPHGTCKNMETWGSKYGTHHGTMRECMEWPIYELVYEYCKCIPWYRADRFYNLNKTEFLDEMVRIVDSHWEKGKSIKDWYSAYGHSDPQHTHVKRSRSLAMENDLLKRSQRDSSDTYNASDSDRHFMNSDYYWYICDFSEQYFCQLQIEYIIRNELVEAYDCREPCEYNHWDVEISTTNFPAKRYYEKNLKDAAGNLTFEYARENLARIHIYYDDLKIEFQSQEPAYEINNFIAEFGGTVDLLIGFSVFTVLQLVEIVIASCIRGITEFLEK